MKQIDWNDYKKEKTTLNLFSIMKKTTPRPNREGLKIFYSIKGEYAKTYPKKCKTDEQKFVYLSDLFMKNNIKKNMFIEFADVLVFQNPELMKKKTEMVADVIERKLLTEIGWTD